MTALHAGLVALRLGGDWRGALIVGPSGCGKSDLALRALAAGFRLVADDRVIVFASAERVFGRAPKPLAGLIEVRGDGIASSPHLPLAQIILVARCAPPEDAIERLPEPEMEVVAGIALPLLRLAPLELSCIAKLRHALGHLGRPRQQAYQAALRPRGRIRGVPFEAC